MEAYWVGILLNDTDKCCHIFILGNEYSIKVRLLLYSILITMQKNIIRPIYTNNLKYRLCYYSLALLNRYSLRFPSADTATASGTHAGHEK